MTAWLSLALALVKIASSIIGYLNSKQMMNAGAAKAALESLEKADAAIEVGRKARAAVRADLDDHPERLRTKDPFQRD